MLGTTVRTQIYSKLYTAFSNDGHTLYTSRFAGGNIYSYREPDLTFRGEGTQDLNLNNVEVILGEGGTSEELANLFTEDYKAMIKSVTKYGGFYIGRYETGNLSKDIPVIKKGNSDTTGLTTWYQKYARQRKIFTNSNVVTEMIWGCQWDITCMWLYKCGYNISDSSSWGNFLYNKCPTGNNDAWKANNIYDLAGNYPEYTQEATYAYNEGARAIRGSNVNALFRAGYSSEAAKFGAFDHLSTRASFYIK